MSNGLLAKNGIIVTGSIKVHDAIQVSYTSGSTPALLITGSGGSTSTGYSAVFQNSEGFNTLRVRNNRDVLIGEGFSEDGTTSGYANLIFPNTYILGGNINIGDSFTNATVGQNTIRIGVGAGGSAQANKFIAIGDSAGGYAKGSNNIMMGFRTAWGFGRAGSANNNVVIGHFAGSGNQNHSGAHGNTIIGDLAALTIGGGAYNTILGNGAGYSINSGNYNTILGRYAGYNMSGSNNVILGHEAGYNLAGSNKLIIADNSSSALVTGDFSNNTFNISGSVSASTFYGDGSNLTGISGGGNAFPFTGSAGISGSLNVNGSTTATTFHGDGSNLTGVGGNAFPFTGSAAITGSLNVNGSTTATTFHGDGSNLTGISGGGNAFPFTGSAAITGSLNVEGATTITGSNSLTGNYALTVINSNGEDIIKAGNDKLLTFATSPFTPQDSSHALTHRIQTREGIYVGNSGNGFGMVYTSNQIKYNNGYGRPALLFQNNGINSTHLFTADTLRGSNGISVGGGTGKQIGVTGGDDLDITFTGYFGSISGPSWIRLNGPDRSGKKGQLELHAGNDPTYSHITLNTNTDERVRITHSGSVGIGVTNPQSNLHVSGAVSASTFYGDGSNLTGISGGGNAFPFTGSAGISGSLEIIGSGSTLFDVVGSQGQLFSITDSLTGSLFAVSDVSGLPILEVFSDDTIKMGSFNNEALEVNGSNVNFNNLPTSDPGVSGRLFKTGSDAIGASAGFQVVCISQG